MDRAYTIALWISPLSSSSQKRHSGTGKEKQIESLLRRIATNMSSSEKGLQKECCLQGNSRRHNDKRTADLARNTQFPARTHFFNDDNRTNNTQGQVLLPRQGSAHRLGHIQQQKTDNERMTLDVSSIPPSAERPQCNGHRYIQCGSKTLSETTRLG